MTVNLVWITPDAEKLIGYMARVSNPKATKDDDATKLIQYLLTHKHWSPFEMASMVVEIKTTRDIGRQILRHRSFHFQEFSQRYAEVPPEPVFREARLQDTKNRQNSLNVDDEELKENWQIAQEQVWEAAIVEYQWALDKGIAKEQARALLPEGMTQTHMYMSGTIRDWIHYLDVRTGVETQLEHRTVANEIAEILGKQTPGILAAAQQAGFIANLRST